MSQIEDLETYQEMQQRRREGGTRRRRWRRRKKEEREEQWEDEEGEDDFCPVNRGRKQCVCVLRAVKCIQRVFSGLGKKKYPQSIWRQTANVNSFYFMCRRLENSTRRRLKPLKTNTETERETFLGRPRCEKCKEGENPRMWESWCQRPHLSSCSWLNRRRVLPLTLCTKHSC